MNKFILLISAMIFGAAANAEVVNLSKIEEKTEIAVREAYLKTAVKHETPWHGKRLQLIHQAKDDCGGRYDHRKLILFKYESDDPREKQYSGPDGNKVYTGVLYTSKSKYLLIEKIACSYHGGYNESTINAVTMSAESSAFVKESVADAEDPVSENFKLEAKYIKPIASKEYKVPYDAQAEQ